LSWTLPRGAHLAKTALLFSLAFLLIASAAYRTEPVAQGQTSSQTVLGVWAPDYHSKIINDTSIPQGASIKIDWNITNAPIMNTFDAGIVYDLNVLKFVSADIKTGTVFGSDGSLVRQQLIPPTLRLVGAKFGVPWQGGSGVLVHLNFTVLKSGVSPLALYETQHYGGQQGRDLLAHTTSDGYFTDRAYPKPTADFTVVPSLLLKGQTATLNATASFDPKNPNGFNKGIAFYDWYFGTNDGTGETNAYPTVMHIFGTSITPRSGVFWVRLIVRDSVGNEGVRIIQVTVTTPARHDLRIFSFDISPPVVVPGQNVAAQITVDNVGDFSETFNVTLRVSQKLIQSWDGNKLPIGNKRLVFNSTITTSDLSAGIYQVTALVSLRQDDVLSNNQVTRQLQIQVQQASILPYVLGIPAAAAAIGGGIFVARRVRSKPAEGPELTNSLPRR